MMMCIWPSEEHTYNLVAEQKHGLTHLFYLMRIAFQLLKSNPVIFLADAVRLRKDNDNRNLQKKLKNWMTFLHYDCSDVIAMDRNYGFVQPSSFSLWSFTKWIHDKKHQANMSAKHIDNQVRLAHKEVKRRSKSVWRRLTWDYEPGCFSAAGPGSRWGNPFAPGSPLMSTHGCDRKRLACRWWWTRCTGRGPAKWTKHRQWIHFGRQH